MFKNPKTRKRATIGLAVVCCLSLLVGSFAFFTDRADATATATAGNIDLVFVDVSNAEAHKVSGQENTDSLVWTDSKITNDAQPIMNPGDNFDMGYALRNTGSKSIDVRQQIILESDVALTEAAREFTLNGTVLTLDETNSTDTKLIYTYETVTLAGEYEADGNAFDAEKGYSEQDFDVYLAFAREAKNAFMDANVTVTLEIQAKQHRNTTDADWMLWASYTTGDADIVYEEIPNN